MIKDSKYVRLDIDDNRFINSLIECMALKTIPILNKEPKLIGLVENVNFVINTEVTSINNDIVSNNMTYYNEKVNINHVNKMINYLIN